MPTTFAAIVLVAFAASLEPAQDPALDTATIVHVTVVDVATGKELPDETVVLQGDHIEARGLAFCGAPVVGVSCKDAILVE